jgi:hypothetical protein
LISFPSGTEIFQFPEFASMPYVFKHGYPCGWVSPFGHPRINVRCQLPWAFRRLPRPSSPLTAKAFVVCAYSLDHITLNPLAYARVSRAINRLSSFCCHHLHTDDRYKTSVYFLITSARCNAYRQYCAEAHYRIEYVIASQTP